MDQQDVGDIAADHVANGQIATAIQGRLHAHGGFRGTGAECHHRQANDQWRNAELRGQFGGAAYQHFGASDQQHQACDQVNEGHQSHCRVAPEKVRLV